MLKALAGTQECYQIKNSLMLDSGISQYLNRTFSTPTNNKIWTFSTWFKRGKITGSYYNFLGAKESAGNSLQLRLNADDTISFYSSLNANGTTTTAVYRDIASWYHLVFAFDSTQASETNRVKIYINEKLQARSAAGAWLAQNYAPVINAAQIQALFSTYTDSYGGFFDGYLSETYFIDGQALDPSYFGRACPITGEWEPKKYNGTYGTNGFYLEFKDTGATAGSNAGLGKDTSGNGNYWTTNGGIGVTNQFIDTPTNNFCVLNPLDIRKDGGVITIGNRWFGQNGLTSASAGATFFVGSGKWVAEFYASRGNSGSFYVGIYPSDKSDVLGSISRGYRNDGHYIKDGADQGLLGPTYANTTDYIRIEFDVDNNALSFYKNGTLAFTDSSAALAGKEWAIFCGQWGTINAGGAYLHTGSQPSQTYPSAGTITSGFKNFCTKNLPVPSIKRPEKYFRTLLYTGNGANLQVGEVQKAQDLITIGNSLRFNSADTAYLSRTPGAQGNLTVWTFGCWAKRSKLSSTQDLFAVVNGTDSEGIAFDSSDRLIYANTIASANIFYQQTDQYVKNLTEWVHLVVARNGSTRTLYINGVAVPTTITVNTTPAANSSFNKTAAHNIGYYGASGLYYLDGYLSDVYFIDGQALTPGDFGQLDGNNYWVPKAYTGTYGTNGFHLDFADSAQTVNSNVGLGKDTSGNANYWVTSNFGYGATGAPNQDQVVDTPTNSYATLDPTYANGAYSSTGLSNGNLTNYATGTVTVLARAPRFAQSRGKWYFEGKVNTVWTQSNGNIKFGISDAIWANPTLGVGVATHIAVQSYAAGGVAALNCSAVANTFTAWANGDVCSIAYDLDKGYAWFRKNNDAWLGGGDPAAGTTPTVYGMQLNNPMYPCFDISSHSGAASTGSISANFGSQGFTYTVPTGFLPLCENNIKEYVYDVETPDLVWLKSRSTAQWHGLFDTVRGVGNQIGSNSTNAQSYSANSLIQFNKNGFYVGSDVGINELNSNFVAWCWKKGVTPGFDIVQFTGTGAVQNINHSLGVTPAMIIYKALNVASWPVMHKNQPDMTTNCILLDGVTPTTLGTPVNAPTSSQFSASQSIVANGVSAIAYLFAEVAGFSKFGSYPGTGNPDGPFIYCGFRPAFIMIKRDNAATSDNWYIWDSKRGTYNNLCLFLLPNSTATEQSDSIDIVSNGFKLRNTGTGFNGTGAYYIFAAFAEMPFKYSNAR